MLTNKEIIQRFHQANSHGVQSDDTRLSNRHIYSVISGIRSQLLSQEIKKNQRVSDWAYQELPCVELVLVPDNECPCTPQIGCMILRSKHKIPSVIVSASRNILSVSGLDGRLKFSETTFEDKKYKKGRKYTKNSPDFFIKNEYLYITVTQRLETVNLRGIFNNTIDADKFSSLCNPLGTCNSYLDYPFYYEEDLIPALIELSVVELLKYFNSTREDRTNNSSDDGNSNIQFGNERI